MRIADTSALYALFSATDAHHEAARAALEDPEPVVVPREIFVETLSLIQYRHGFDAALAAGLFLRALRHVKVRATPPRLAEDAWAAYADAKGALSLPDATVVAWCRREGAKPLAFDRRLARRVAA